MLKRTFDFLAALPGLLIMSPILLGVALAIYLYDRHSPFYVPKRMARGGGTFRMVKFRSMVANADKTGVNSTSASDRRITPMGCIVRRCKLDEFTQLWNVLLGDMSLVGPRPQVEKDASMYTDLEKRMLSVHPGITDLSSIVFADEGDILAGSPDPDLLYNQVIRPWKSRMALLYIERRTLFLDLRIIALTAIGFVSRRRALDGVQRILRQWGADDLVIRMAGRREPLLPYPPPGATEIVAQYC